MTDIPEWAMLEARAALIPVSEDAVTDDQIHSVARALVAERTAERERCAKIVLEADQNNLGMPAPWCYLAAATIRKGEL